MITIQVIKQNTGRPAKNVRVAVEFHGWTRGFSDTKHTDANGEVHISNDNGDATVYLNGTTHWKGKLSGRKVFYI